MRKVIRVGKENRGNIFASIKIMDGVLSISGVIGPMRNGSCKGGAGQIDIEYAHRNHKDDDPRYQNPVKACDIDYADGWDAEKWLDFLDIWRHWHLNDLRAECEHQRKEGWDANEKGLLGKPCAVCGYKYGTAWLKEELPENVIKFLKSLPDADITPAWV